MIEIVRLSPKLGAVWQSKMVAPDTPLKPVGNDPKSKEPSGAAVVRASIVLESIALTCALAMAAPGKPVRTKPPPLPLIAAITFGVSIAELGTIPPGIGWSWGVPPPPPPHEDAIPRISRIAKSENEVLVIKWFIVIPPSQSTRIRIPSSKVYANVTFITPGFYRGA